MKKVIITLALLALAGCSDNEGARKALLDAGYTNINVSGARVFGCSDSDSFITGFKATGPTGRPVEGVVCSGFGKGKTIRLD